MKKTVYIKNSFKSNDASQLKKAVTEKIDKLINISMTKAD